MELSRTSRNVHDMELKAIAELVIWLDDRLPSTGYVSLYELQREIVADDEVPNISRRSLIKMIRSLDQVLVLSTELEDEDPMVARARTRRAPCSRPAATFRRQLDVFLGREIQPGEYYPCADMYAKFSREVLGAAISPRSIGQAVDKSKFEMRTHRVNKQPVRCIQRRV